MPVEASRTYFMCYFSAKKWKSGNFIEKSIGKVEISKKTKPLLYLWIHKRLCYLWSVVLLVGCDEGSERLYCYAGGDCYQCTKRQQVAHGDYHEVEVLKHQ